MVSSKILTLCFLIVVAFAFGPAMPTVKADVILADSIADWNSATADGIDVNGNAVVAGSSQDAAQQGHDATSNGTWRYKGTGGAGSGPFSGGTGELTNWVNDPSNAGSAGCYLGANSCRMRAHSMAPSGTFNGDTFAVREWQGSGLAGETLRITGSFDTLLNTNPVSNFNNGVHVQILLNNSTTLFDQLIFPGGIATFDFLAVIPTLNPFIRFTVGPQGPGPAILGSSDFFGDTTRFSGQISMVTNSVPSPSSLMLLALGLLNLCFISRGVLRASF